MEETKLLSIQEATARIVENQSLCMRSWGSGGFMAYAYDKETGHISALPDGGLYPPRDLVIQRPEDIFSYWRVDPIEVVQRDRAAAFEKSRMR